MLADSDWIFGIGLLFVMAIPLFLSPIAGIRAAVTVVRKGYGVPFGLTLALTGLSGPLLVFLIARHFDGMTQYFLQLAAALVPGGIALTVATIMSDQTYVIPETRNVVEGRSPVNTSDSYLNSVSAGQIRCSRCGSMNAAELVECWHCGLELAVGEQQAEISTIPSKQPVTSKPLNNHAAARARLKEKLRIECKSCGKQMQGQKVKVQTLKRCPKCGAAPFDYRQLPKSG